VTIEKKALINNSYITRVTQKPPRNTRINQISLSQSSAQGRSMLQF